MKLLKKFLTKEFLFTLIVSMLAFRGAEALLEDWFAVDIDALLALGGAGVIVLWGMKLHVICCAVPALYAAYKCANSHEDHCDHSHSEVVDVTPDKHTGTR